jgi:transposase
METCAVDERMRFVIAAEKHEEAFAAICRRFGVSRRVGYKWLARYEEAGVEGLLDRSRHRSVVRRRLRRRSPNAALRCGGRIRPGVR